MIKLTFKTHSGKIWKTATVKTMKRARAMHDREDLKYGAILQMIVDYQLLYYIKT